MPFTRAHWLYSFKLFAAAMIAYALSIHLGLLQGYWAVVTCCVVMNSTTGGILAKGVLRLTGTACAGLSALMLASVFGNTPVLLIVIAGVLTAIAFSWAVLDRTPGAYGFQVYGVTLLMVAVASIEHPETMFDTAVARTMEIGLGIFCCTVIDSVISPGSLAPVLHQRIGVWMPRMRAWMDDVFLGERLTANKVVDQQKSIADITSLTMLVGQLRYDPLVSRWERQCAIAIQQRMLRLIPLLASIDAHLTCLEAERRARVLPVLRQSWLRMDDLPTSHDLETSPADPTQEQADANRNWQDLVEASLMREANLALAVWGEARQMSDSLANPTVLAPALRRKVRAAKAFPLSPDFHIAGSVALATLLAYGSVALLWWSTGWSQGANAMLLAMVAIGVFGALDEAGMIIGTFARVSAGGLLLAAAINYGLLPLAADFTSLVLLLALVMLPLGAWAASNPLVVLLLAMTFTSVNLQPIYAPVDFASFLDSASSSLLGIMAGCFCLLIVRRMGAAHLLERFAEREKLDIHALSLSSDARSVDRFVNRSLDRAAAMALRVGAQDGDGKDHSTSLLAWLRLGVAIGTIRMSMQYVGGARRRSCEALLQQLRRDMTTRGVLDSTLLRQAVEASLSAAVRRVGRKPDALLQALIDLRLVLLLPHVMDLEEKVDQ